MRIVFLLTAAGHVHSHGYLESILDVANPMNEISARPRDHAMWSDDGRSRQDDEDCPGGDYSPDRCGVKLTPFEDAKTIADRGCGGAPNMLTNVRRPTSAFMPGQLIRVRWVVSSEWRHDLPKLSAQCH